MFNPMKKLMSHLKGFKDNMSGTISVEAIIMLPLLLWLIAAMAVFLDVFRTKSTMDKAAFTISDALSRETNAITPAYLDNTHTLFDELSNLQDGSSMRVSLIKWSSIQNNYVIDWSEIRGDEFVPLTGTDITWISEHLPDIGATDSLILVETHYSYQPLYDIGPMLSGRNNESYTVVDPETGEEQEVDVAWDLDMGLTDMTTFVFTRPRYASQLVFDSSS